MERRREGQRVGGFKGLFMLIPVFALSLMFNCTGSLLW